MDDRGLDRRGLDRGPDRPDLLLETVVALADTLTDDYDVIDFLQTLAERSVALLDISAAGVMLADGAGRLRHAACSEERMRLVELFEIQISEGPCFDAYQQGTSVRADDVGGVADRWPTFAPHARAAGFVGVSAVPLRLRAQAVGALNLFSDAPGALGDDDLRIAQALADVATIGILQERTVADARETAERLEAALASRVAIEQAKGIVAEYHQVDVDEAFTLIRRYSRSRGDRLGATARALVDQTLRPSVLVRLGPPGGDGGGLTGRGRAAPDGH